MSLLNVQIKSRLSYLCFLFIFLLLFVNILFAENQSEVITGKLLKQKEQEITQIIEKSSAAIVSISTEKILKSQSYSRKPEDELFDNFFRDFFYGDISNRKIEQIALGSGVIVDHQGHILTNEFIVADAQQITVTLFDSRKFTAKLKNVSLRENLAVIKIEAPDLMPLILSDSDDLKPGQTVIAMGNPFGFSQDGAAPIASVGVIAALHRSLPHTALRWRSYLDLIQTDAVINPGNSGGALLNLEGEIVGINVAVGRSDSSFGFAIPINRGKEILRKLKQGNEILKERLGIKIQDLNFALAEYFNLKRPEGALVLEVYLGSSAEAANLKADDIIIKFNDIKIRNSLHFFTEINKWQSPKKVKIKIMRKGLAHTFTLSLQNTAGQKNLQLEDISETVEIKQKEIYEEQLKSKEAVTNPLKIQSNRFRGLKVSAITEEFAKNFDIESTQGVIVTDVSSGSAGAQAGIKVKDIIIQINTTQIKSLQDYEQILPELSGNVLIKTDRGYLIIEE
ncbi:MAG: trypsin-like peptidase domain-containing protein [Candidatus Omnitrophota bacterium]